MYGQQVRIDCIIPAEQVRLGRFDSKTMIKSKVDSPLVYKIVSRPEMWVS